MVCRNQLEQVTTTRNKEQGTTTRNKEQEACASQAKREETKKAKETVFDNFAGEDVELRSALRDFETMRKAIKKPLTPRAQELVTKQLQRDFKREDWVQVLQQSVQNSWQGLFPISDRGAQGDKRDSGKKDSTSTVDRLLMMTKEGAFDE